MNYDRSLPALDPPRSALTPTSESINSATDQPTATPGFSRNRLGLSLVLLEFIRQLHSFSRFFDGLSGNIKPGKVERKTYFCRHGRYGVDETSVLVCRELRFDKQLSRRGIGACDSALCDKAGIPGRSGGTDWPATDLGGGHPDEEKPVESHVAGGQGTIASFRVDSS